MPALETLFQYVPLTEMVTRVMGGIPKVFPDQFWSLTRDIPGDRFRAVQFRGTRKLPRVSRYGSPPRNVARVGRGQTELVMIHTIEATQASHELLTLLRKWDDYVVQQMARDMLEQDSTEFGRRMENFRTAVLTQSLAYGHLYFAADGTIQLTSSGADLDLDYGIPATNINQVDTSGSGANIITESWDDPGANIPTQVLNLKTYARQKSGYELKYAFMGKNVPGYLSTNSSFREYLARNPQKNQEYINSGMLADVLGLQWISVQDAFYETDAGVITELFPADQVTFYPELSKTTYELCQGGYPVPKTFGIAPDLQGLASQMEYAYGVFKYGYMMPGHMQIHIAQGDTFFPYHKIPEAIFLVDTAF